jgi:drug/metabolite transporter (DMT)-like permease
MTLSLLGITLAYLVFHWSLDFATIPQVATAVTTIPIYVALINMVVNKQPISIAKVLSGICAILGVALLITDGYLTDLVSTSRNLLGVFMAVVCAAAVSAYSVLVRPIIVQYGALRITAITMMIGGIGLWLLVGWAFHIWVTPTRLVELSVTSLVSLLVIALWNTTITQFLWIGGLAALPDITRGSYLFFLKPVIAALLAVLILGQHITGVQILAIGVVCASVFGEVFLAKRSGVA